MFKNKELFRVVMIFVIGIILVLMTPILFKVVMELFLKYKGLCFRRSRESGG